MTMGEELSASEAVYGFASWLTTRKKQTFMGATHDAAVVAELVDLFCKVNELEPPRDNFDQRLLHPEE
jgi:hypothetical protein